VGERTAWSAAGGAVAAVAGTNAATWAVAAYAAHSPLPRWPAYTFGLLAVLALYVLIASLVPLPPFGRIRSVPELLDEYIRDGQDRRDRIVTESLSGMDAAAVGAEWMLVVANGLRARFPAIKDEFLLASGDEGSFSGQALLIQTINAKLRVLRDARKGLGT
jgi:hypothetical protein